VSRSTGSGSLLRLFLLDLDRGSARIEAADRAGVMNLLGLVAMRTCLEVRDRQSVVGATITLSGV
jgi:ribosomal protein L30/L7E